MSNRGYRFVCLALAGLASGCVTPWRLETRVAARLSEVLSTLGEQSLSGAPALRKRILTEAQAVVDEALRQWEHGAEYRVEIVIASLYWTDSSLGRLQQRRGW